MTDENVDGKDVEGVAEGERVDTKTGEILTDAPPAIQGRFSPAGAIGVVQGELPGVMPVVTKAYLRAEECARQRLWVKIAREKLKVLEQNLLYAMHEEKLKTVKVRDEAGFLHQFDIEELERVKYTTFG